LELIVICFGLLILGAPIIALIVSFSALSRAAAVGRHEMEINALRADLDGLAARVAGRRVAPQAAGPYRVDVPMQPPVAPRVAVPTWPVASSPIADERARMRMPSPPIETPQPAPTPTVEPAAAAPSTSIEERVSPVAALAAAARESAKETKEAAPEPAFEAEEPAPRTRLEWEKWLGVRGAAALGAIVLVIAGLYFFKYSIDAGVLTPMVRVVLGGLVGAACIATAELGARVRHTVLANWLAGAGVAIFYATTWAARSLYDLIPAEGAFAAMVAITLGCAALAMRRRAFAIALLGLLGGFAAPLVLASHSNRPVALFAYLLLLDAALLFVAARSKWPALALLSLVGTTLYQGLWFAARADDNAFLFATGLVALFAIAFAALPRLFGATSKDSILDRVTNTAALVVPMLYGVLAASRPTFIPSLGALVAFLVVLNVGAIVIARRGDRMVLAFGALGATAAMLGLWMAQHGATGAEAWELSAAIVALFGLFHVGLEMDRGAVRFAPVAGLALVLGAVLLVLMPSDTTLPTAGGALILAALGLRQATFNGRALLAIPVAVAIPIFGVVFPLHADAPLPAMLAIVVVAPAILALVARTRPEEERATFLAAAATSALLGMASALLSGEQTSLSFGVAILVLAVSALVTLANAGFAYGPLLVLLATAAVHSFRIAEHATHDVTAHDVTALVGVAASALLSLAWPFAVPAARIERWSFRAAALAIPLHAFAIGASLVAVHVEADVVIELVAVTSLAAYGICRELHLADDVDRVARTWFLGFFATALTGSLVHRLDGATLASALTIEGLIVIALGLRHAHTAIRHGGVAIMIAGVARLALALDVRTHTGAPFVNALAPMILIPALALGVAWWLLRNAKPTSSSARFTGGLATVLVFVWLNAAVVDAFGNGGFLLDELSRLPLVMSIAWVVFALALLGLGMRRGSATQRWTSLILVLLATLKLFLYDLSYLRDLARVGSLVGLAVSLIGMSALYQRFVLRADKASQG
jgi:uncharacterized membrane protein